MLSPRVVLRPFRHVAADTSHGQMSLMPRSVCWNVLSVLAKSLVKNDYYYNYYSSIANKSTIKYLSSDSTHFDLISLLILDVIEQTTQTKIMITLLFFLTNLILPDLWSGFKSSLNIHLFLFACNLKEHWIG